VFDLNRIVVRTELMKFPGADITGAQDQDRGLRLGAQSSNSEKSLGCKYFFKVSKSRPQAKGGK